MTITIVTATTRSPAPPSAFFDRWADMASWPEWNGDLVWARLDGPFAEGSRGKLKPTKGPTTSFVISRLEPGHRYTDVSRLPGARLTFDHRVAVEDGATRVDVTVSLEGPLARLWDRVLGGGFRATAQRDLDALAAVAVGAASGADR